MSRRQTPTASTAEGCLLITGVAKGPISHSHEVVVAADGRLSGGITAPRIVIDGEVDGNLVATDCIHIGAAGRVHGDLRSPRISVETGGQLRGRIRMHGGTAAAKTLDEVAVHGLLVGDGP